MRLAIVYETKHNDHEIYVEYNSDDFKTLMLKEFENLHVYKNQKVNKTYIQWLSIAFDNICDQLKKKTLYVETKNAK